MTELTLQQGSLLGGDHGREGEVVIRHQRPIVRNRCCKPINGAGAEGRNQHAGLALYRRIGGREIRKISQRNAEEFEPRILEIQHLLALIVDDPHSLDLPFGRLGRIIRTGFAGGVDAVVKHGEIAPRALGPGSGEAGLLGRIDSQRVDEAVAVVIAEIHDRAARYHAGLVEHDIAFGVQALRLLIVDDAIGLEGRIAIVDLHVSDCGNALVRIVVIDLLGAHEHLLLPARALGSHRRLRSRREREHFLAQHVAGRAECQNASTGKNDGCAGKSAPE